MKKGRYTPHNRLLGMILSIILLAIASVIQKMPEIEKIISGGFNLDELLNIAIVLLLVVGIYDCLKLSQIRDFTIKRNVPKTLPLHVWTEVSVEIIHPYMRATTIEIFDTYPDGFEIKNLPLLVDLLPNKTSEITYQLRPNRRGDAHFGVTELAISSPLKLWKQFRKYGNETKVLIYPNFAAIKQYELLAIDNHTSNLGVIKKPRRGEGMEFHQLRDYRSGDSLQLIDWKATARRLKLISREFQDERDQQIYFMVDCGRRMNSQYDELTHFDHSLNAILLLSYVALRQGDAVGMISFGGDRRWLPAKNSINTINSILNSVYNLHPTNQAPDYTMAAKEFIARQRKRSLVILVTNMREGYSDDIIPALQLLRKRHLVLLASLRDEVLDDTISQTVEGFGDSLTYAATQNYLESRFDTMKRIQAMGIHSLDVYPRKLSAKLVNSYLEIKHSNLL